MAFQHLGIHHKLKRCRNFFLGLYRSAAEPMPHEHYMVKGSVDKNIEIDEDLVFRRSGEAEDDNVDVWNPDRPITGDLAAFLGGEIGVARRYLPNSTLSSLYWLMASQLAPESARRASRSHLGPPSTESGQVRGTSF